MEAVVNAIQNLYTTSSGPHRQHANSQLIAWQKLPESWTIAFELLQLNDPNVQFFAAQTLAVKISRDLEQLKTLFATSESKPEEQLKERLMQEITRISSTAPQFIQRKLVLALVSYCLHCPWQSMVEEITGSLLNNLPILFEYLTMLPEEFTRTDLTKEHKIRVESELYKAYEQVLQLMFQALESSNGDGQVKVKALRCIQSWMHLEIPVTLLPKLLSVTTAQLRQSNNSETFEQAVELLVDLLNSQKILNYEATVCEGLLLSISTGWFRERFDRAVAEDEQEEFVKPACRLLVAFGETFTEYLIKNSLTAPVCSLFDMLLQCTGYRGYHGVDEELADLPLNFWYLLQDTLLDSVDTFQSEDFDSSTNLLSVVPSSIEAIAGGSVASIIQSPPQTSNLSPKIHQHFKEIFSQLVPLLRHKCIFPSDSQWANWSLDSRVKFRNYRRDLSDTIVYCHYIIQEKTFDILLQNLSVAYTNSWQEMEATLFCLKSLADVTGVAEQPLIERLFSALLSAPPRQPLRLVQTCIYLFGAFNSWLGSHASDRIVQSTVEYIMTFMERRQVSNMPLLSDAPDLGSTVFRTFKDIAEGCRSKLTYLTPQLTFIFQSEQFMSQATFNARNRLQFTETLLLIVKSLPVNQQTVNFSQIINCCATRMQNDLNNSNSNCDVAIELIDCATVIVKAMQPEFEDQETGTKKDTPKEEIEVFLDLLSSSLSLLWPCLSALIERFSSNDDFLQRFTTFIDAVCWPLVSKDTKRILTFLQLRPDFLVSICETFSNSIISNLTRGVSPIWFDATISLLRTFGTFELAFPPIHPIEEDKFVVYLDRISVALFQLTQSCIQSFLTVISTITPRNTNTSTSTITPSNSSNLEEMPDLVEGLFSLVEVCLKEHPAAFFGPLDPLTANPHLMPLFTLALQGLSLQERNSFKSVAQFFVTFINLQTAYRKPSLSTQSLDLKVIVNTIMTALLPDITQRLVSGIAWTLPRSSILFAADVLYSTIRTYPHEMQSLLKTAVGAVERLSLKEKELIVKQFLSTRILRNFKEHTKEFFIKSRGLDGTAFGSTF